MHILEKIQCWVSSKRLWKLKTVGRHPSTRDFSTEGQISLKSSLWVKSRLYQGSVAPTMPFCGLRKDLSRISL